MAKKKAKAKRPMNRPTDAARRIIVTEIEMAISRGMTDAEILARFHREKGIPDRTLRRYLSKAYEGILKRTMLRRRVLVSRQNAKLDHAQRLALAGKKAVNYTREEIRNGQIVSVTETKDVPAPDLHSLVRAIAEQDKLLGLNAPSQHQVLVANLDTALGRLVGILRSYIPDPATRKRLIEELREAADGDLRRSPGLLSSGDQLVEGQAEVVEEPEDDGRRNGS